ncbi:Serine-type D-Ala-D-Ala carboxypeptidase [Methylocella silvestris BL2]|uniref:Serine-type D-Ala-D-Ala carboxypeptidase n=1 Tax=Methylocella silvestris (strain DSM 15510 / CIP 108128 / LMG 27833 / NCIMB 13906 / BL2) TaxID=395965 RepID=B8EPD3_METSB|nr:D-alanyl-D-alanine carboxypeptidase family protein [Methylocella silvestris]ACK49721.1 Serine-type D-Ala-D-Ala carboxypeptidase [Methylocella silvestris BL2]
MLDLGATVRRSKKAEAFSGLALLVAVSVAAVSFFAGPAEARQRSHGHHAGKHFPGHYGRAHHAHSVRYMRARPFAPSRNFAAIVVDGNSGEALYARNEDEPRHPASITKVMTLYLLFEQLEQGRLRLDSEIPISARAAAQKPTKLGLRPGRTISVDDAIKAIVTRSANDIAVAIAEAVGGDEDRFADLMTRKARELGMRNTKYVNASGLPADAQITTARDLSILGRAVQERFPRYYRYFSTRTFYFAGAAIRNHNRLMDRVEGMDGIKTGYTNASGFNLLTSVKRDGHYIVAVVMGGVSAPSRDRIMADLIEDQIGNGATVRTASVLRDLPQRPVERDTPPTDLPSRAVAQQQAAPAAAPQLAAAAPLREIAPAPKAALAYVATQPAAQAPTQKITLRAITPQPPQAIDPIRVASISADVPLDKPRPAFVSGAVKTQPTPATANDAEPGAARRVAVRTASLDGSTMNAAFFAPPTATPSTMRWVAGPAPAKLGKAEKADRRAVASAEPPRLAAPAEKTKDVEGKNAEQRPAAAARGWMIQIGATDDIAKANALLAKARISCGRTLNSAQPFTEKVQKGSETLYRARFAGLEEKSAENACRTLKQSGLSCFATKN